MEQFIGYAIKGLVTSSAVVFPVMVPTFPSLGIALVLVHVLIRLRMYDKPKAEADLADGRIESPELGHLERPFNLTGPTANTGRQVVR